jgi:predicted metal-dependent enzyme (double-stranded beta helix superfamily)
MRVESGSLQVCNYQLDSEEPLTLSMVDLVKGDKGYLDGPAEIHSVANIFSKPAVSLHVYAKPFAQCDIYCLETGTIKRIELVYDSIYKDPC